jgi:hypothetical protein
MSRHLEIQTIWRTATEQCEVVFGQFIGFHVRVWVQGRLICDELASDAQAAVRRAWELRTEWPTMVPVFVSGLLTA